jgi:arylsulfatase A
VPFIARWPGKIPSGKTVAEPAMTVDLLPTIAKLIGGRLPGHKIDGVNIWPLLTAERGAISAKDAYWVYYGNNQLQAVISGRWKLILPHRYRTMAGKPGGQDGTPNKYSSDSVKKPELYDLYTDVTETDDVAAAYPGIMKQMLAHAEAAYADLGDGPLKKPGPGIRPAGQMPDAR